MDTRLADEWLDACLCQPDAPLAGDPARTFGLDKHAAKARLAHLKPWLLAQQRRLWANRRQALLLVLQGPDCSGKDGVISRVVSAFDPQCVSVHGFQAPTAQERQQHFLQRYRQRLPAAGMLGVFNRSHYEALICDPLDGLCSEEELPARLTELRAFEEQLPARSIVMLKCYLQIDRAEQYQRLVERLERPEKRWKLKISDLHTHRQFDERQLRWSRLLSASHVAGAPWYVIPAHRRWLRDLLVASLLARELERLHLNWPDRPAPFSLAELQAASAHKDPTR
ncbi:polyphosphate kinase 2 family protein [Pseudomonas sp. NCHU5208]|uniref:polyphosphate kinase 2 family protein n=1 Tax=unclassified Pseudomonas TaxID=196821 RepID=UPI003F96A0DC